MKSPDSGELDQEKHDLANKLTLLRDGYSDEIPEQILRGGGLYKVRINWWAAIIGPLLLGRYI